MNRAGKFIFLFLVLGFIIAAGAAGVFLFFSRILPEDIGREKIMEEKRDLVREFPFSTAGALVDWDEKLFTPRRSEYRLAREEGKSCVHGISNDSASALYYEHILSHEKRPFISWEWKAKKFPGRKGDERINAKKEFDFVAQVYVIFYSKFFLKTRAIQYVWTEKIPVGTVGASPFTKNVKVLVLESGLSETWKKEDRDINADYRMLFGEELDKDIRAIAFMTDADSNNSTSEAYFADIRIGYLDTGGKE